MLLIYMLNVNGRIKLGVHPLENWGENWSQVDVQGIFFNLTNIQH